MSETRGLSDLPSFSPDVTAMISSSPMMDCVSSSSAESRAESFVVETLSGRHCSSVVSESVLQTKDKRHC